MVIYILFIAKIVQMICVTGKLYSTQMHKILNGDLERNDKKPVEFELNNGTCVCVNNIQVIISVVHSYSWLKMSLISSSEGVLLKFIQSKSVFLTNRFFLNNYFVLIWKRFPFVLISSLTISSFSPISATKKWLET